MGRKMENTFGCSSATTGSNNGLYRQKIACAVDKPITSNWRLFAHLPSPYFDQLPNFARDHGAGSLLRTPINKFLCRE